MDFLTAIPMIYTLFNLYITDILKYSYLSNTNSSIFCSHLNLQYHTDFCPPLKAMY